MAKVKKKSNWSLHDILSRLTLAQSAKLIGSEGKSAISKRSTFELELEEHITFTKQYISADLSPFYEEGADVAVNRDNKSIEGISLTYDRIPEEEDQSMANNMEKHFANLVEKDETGAVNLTIKMPDETSLKAMIQSMANFQVFAKTMKQPSK